MYIDHTKKTWVTHKTHTHIQDHLSMACPRRFLNDNMTDWTTISWWIAGQIDISCWFHLIWWLNHHFSRWKKSTEEESPPLAASPASSSSGMLSGAPKGDDKLCEPPMGISMGTGRNLKTSWEPWCFPALIFGPNAATHTHVQNLRTPQVSVPLFVVTCFVVRVGQKKHH